MRGAFGPEMTALAFNESLLAKSEEDTNSRSSFSEAPDIDSEEVIKKFIKICQCEVSDDEHFHCKLESCNNALLG